MDKSLRLQMIFSGLDKASGTMKKIKGEGAALSQQMRDTRKSLAELQDTQSDVKSFRTLKRGVQDTKKEMAEASDRATRLGRAIAETDKPTKRQREEFQRAARSADKLKDKWQRQTAELNTLRNRLSSVGVNTRELVNAEKRLATQVAMTNDRLASQKTKLAELNRSRPQRLDNETRLAQRADRMKRAGGMVATATAAAGAATGYDAVTNAATFQDRMTDIGQKADLAKKDTDSIAVRILEIAPKISQLPDDVAASLDNLAGAGMDPRQAIKMVEPIGKAATAYKADMDELGDATFAAVDNLKVPVEQTERILDIMATGGKAGRFELKDMAAYFPMLTGAMAALHSEGLPAVADLTAALQITRKTTGDASSAATNLQNVLLKMNTKETIKRFKEFGVDVPAALKKAEREGRSPLETMIELTNKATKGDQSKLSFLFGDQQVVQAMQALIPNLQRYREIRSEALMASGDIDRDFAARSQNTAVKWQRVKAQWAANTTFFGDMNKQATNFMLDGASFLLDRWWNQTTDGLKAKTQEHRTAVHAEGQKLNTEMRSIGRDAMIGLGDGLMFGFPRVLQLSRSMMDRLEGEWRKKYRIHSPSRLFMDFGRYMTEGLAIGIDRGSGQTVSRMRLLADQLADSVPHDLHRSGSSYFRSGGSLSSTITNAAIAPNSATANGSVLQQFGPVTIVIHAAPGQSPQDIAEAVASQLRQQADSRRASHRSAFTDT